MQEEFAVARNVGNLHGVCPGCWCVGKGHIRRSIGIAWGRSLRRGVEHNVLGVQHDAPATACRGTHIHTPQHREVLLARHLHKPAIAAFEAPARTDRAEMFRVPIGPHNHFATVTGLGGIGPHRGTCSHVSTRRILNQRILALVVTAHQNRATTSHARSVDLRGAGQLHFVTQDLNLATPKTRGKAIALYSASHSCNAARATTQDDVAVPLDSRVRPYHATLIDDCGQCVTQRAGQQGHLAASGIQRARVGHSGLDGRRIH